MSTRDRAIHSVQGVDDILADARRLHRRAYDVLQLLHARVTPARVLLVEDHASLRASLALLLTSLGYRIAEAASVSDALTVAVTFAPDVALIDLGLPDGDGAALARALRDAVPTLWASVALTGSIDDATRTRALDAGCAAVLTKPCDLDELSRTLAACLPSATSPGRVPTS